jgi:hypothetical protein
MPRIMKRIPLALLLGGLASASLLQAQGQAKKGAKPAAAAPFSVVEATIPEMRAAMEQGRVTSRELVRQSLERIALYEDRLNAVITVNPNALREAEERDRERAQGKLRGPLHGIPIALKDNSPHDRHADDRRRARFRRLRAALRGHADEEPAATPARSSSPRPA